MSNPEGGAKPQEIRGRKKEEKQESETMEDASIESEKGVSLEEIKKVVKGILSPTRPIPDHMRSMIVAYVEDFYHLAKDLNSKKESRVGGGNLSDIRRRHYPDWTKENFLKAIELIEEEAGPSSPQEIEELPVENLVGMAKQRALELLERGDLREAVNSLVRDMYEFDRSGEVRVRLSAMYRKQRQLLSDSKLTKEKVRDFIEDFENLGIIVK